MREVLHIYAGLIWKKNSIIVPRDGLIIALTLSHWVMSHVIATPGIYVASLCLVCSTKSEAFGTVQSHCTK